MPLISVIVPVYNVEPYIRRCIDSILSQTFTDFELILVDDGSPDNCPAICDEYAKKDSRVHVIHQENRGLSAARNAGLDRMTGEYVTFVDPDDFVHPQYIEFLYQAVIDTGLRIAICDLLITDSNKNAFCAELLLFSPDHFRVWSFHQIFKTKDPRFYSCGGKLIHRGLIQGLRFNHELKNGEDTLFFAEICENDNNGRVAVLSNSLYYYYQREGSAAKNSGTPEMLHFCRIWLQQLQLSNRDEIYLHNVLKWYLSLRYQSIYIYADKETSKECKTRLIQLRPRLLNTKIYGFVEKMAYLAFVCFPYFDKLHRVIRDPSLLQWEKNERRKRRNER